ncbi:unnamed protein product [marine sediment metagenome]|uniref:Uncharacterized protein n=1 Tax=marine sediment metagenome TaxID=412755 RepID=X0TGL8_9ZZZZ
MKLSKNEKGLGKTKFFQKNKTKNLISMLLPLGSIFTVFIMVIILRTQPTGFAGYIDETLYRLNGSVAITLQEEIPGDSYVRIRIDKDVIKMNLIEVLERSGKWYKISDGYIIANDTYSIDFASLGITQGLRKGRHRIIVEIVYKELVLQSDERIIEI